MGGEKRTEKSGKVRRFVSHEGLAAFGNFAKKRPEFTAGLVIVLGMILVAVFAAQLSPYSPTALSLSKPLQPPSLGHPFGTDNFGRDIFSRVIYGARPDLTISITAVALSIFIGVPVGILSGYRGRKSDMVIMAIVDIMLAFPIVIFAMGLIISLGTGVLASIIAIGIARDTPLLTDDRGDTLAIRQSQYVEAAYAAGAGDRRIMLKHVFPNVQPGIIVFATLGIGNALLIVAALSFIGLGVSPPTAEWGLMVYEGTDYILRGDWWMATFPGLAILLAVLGFNLIGDGLRDIIDPRSRSR